MGLKNKKKFIWVTPTTSHFFGSLGVPEHEKNFEHALIRCQTFLPTKLISKILCDFSPPL